MHFILKIAQRKNGGQPLRRGSRSRRRRASGERTGPTDASCFVRVATQSPWTKEVRCWVCFPIRTTRVTKIDLRHGDVLVLYTDGAVEAENQAGEQYSATRLAKIASMYSQPSADELVETIYRSITEFRGTKRLADDRTLVVLKTC
jgi:hypothetical protein